jgi:hypothetical protein
VPGVIVSTQVRSGPSGEGEVKEAQAFFAGVTQRGPIDEAKLIRGVSEFESLYGGYESGNLHSDIRTYFEEGGERAVIYRVAATNASTSTLTLSDGTENTLQVDAANPGAWANGATGGLSVEVTDGNNADTFKILLYLNDVLQYTTRDLSSPADAVSVLNTSPVNHLIVVTDLGSGQSPPSNNPEVVSATNLTGGDDGDPLVDNDFIDALDMFTIDFGVGAVALPGRTGEDIWDALIAHSAANNRIALLAFPEDATVSTITANTTGGVGPYYSNEYAEYAAFYHPWIKVPDPATEGLTITTSPEAYAAAARAKAITQTGPWRAGAGLISEAQFVTGTVSAIDQATGDLLDEKRINAIRKIGGGYRVYGARSVDSDEDNWRYITFRDTVNYIVSQAEERLEDFIFQAIDARGSLFSRIEAALVGLLDPIRIAGGLFEAFDDDGALVDPGYSVEVSDLLNPVSALAQGKIAAKVGIRISSIGDTIVVTITKSNLTTSVL